MNVKRVLMLLAATVWLPFYLPLSHAQTPKWPEKPVRVIVPFPPGGTTDVVARVFAPQMAEEFGQQFVVDNRPGAGGAIGAEIAARAYPDGHTIIVVTSSYAANGALYKLPYDPVKGIAPVSLISILPFILAAHPSVKATNLKDFIELARGNPGTLNFGSPGTGSGPHLTAVTTAQRAPSMPDVPAIGEVLPGYAVAGWAGMWAPAGTPADVVAKLNRSVARILRQPDVQARLRSAGAEPAPSSAEEFARLIAQDLATWSQVVKTGNIRIE